MDVSDGLCNGASGEITAIESGTEVESTLVKFYHKSVGKKARNGSKFRNEHPDSVPINRTEATFNNKISTSLHCDGHTYFLFSPFCGTSS